MCAWSETIEGLYSYDKKYAEFEVDEWHDYLKRTRVKTHRLSVCIENGERFKYQDFNIYVSPYELKDWGLTYRRIALVMRCMASWAFISAT